MARIAGVDIPREKRVDVSLRYIFGIGETTAKEVLEQARIEGATRVRDLTEPQVASKAVGPRSQLIHIRDPEPEGVRIRFPSVF